MLPASTPPNDDEKEDLPEKVGAGETADEHLNDDQPVIEANPIGADDEEELATSGAGGFETAESEDSAGLDVSADDYVPADDAVLSSSTALPANESQGASVSPPDLSVSEPLLPTVDDLASASLTTLPPNSPAPEVPKSVPSARANAEEPYESPSAGGVVLADSRSPGSSFGSSISAAVATTSTASPSMTRPLVLVSLLELQTRRIVAELLAGQVDRDAQVLEEMVMRKIDAAFTHRACEEKAAYGDW